MSYVKYGAIAALVIALFGFGWYGGALSGKAQVATFRSEQAANTAKAVLAERASTAAELSRLQTVVATYENAPIDPVAVGISHRVLIYASAASCPVSSPGSHPSGTVSTSSVSPSVEDALQDYINACQRDAQRLDALIQAWPR